MRVRVLTPTKAYWNYEVREFGKGDVLEGDLARILAANAAPDTVEVLEADPVWDLVAEQPPPPENPGPAGDGGPPVDGTIDDLMTWVDGDQSRAAQALAAEQAKDKPRSTVVKRLAALTE